MEKADGAGASSEEGYYAAIESHFVERRGSPLFITPSEWELVWRWEQKGIPLAVVKEGIDRVFERPKTGNRPRKLGYCRQTVEAAFRRHREAVVGSRSGAGGGEGAADEVDVSKQLAAMAEALEAVEARGLGLASAMGGILRETRARLRQMAEEVPGASSRSIDAIEEELVSLDERIADGAEAALDDDARRRLRGQAEDSLASYRERMPEKIYLAALRSSFRRRLRASLGLVRLSLLDR